MKSKARKKYFNTGAGAVSRPMAIRRPKVDVVSVSRYGIWINAGGKEYVLPYAEFPWFKNAQPGQLRNIRFLHGHHLFWPKLDIDLDLDCISNPKNYPLQAKIPNKRG